MNDHIGKPVDAGNFFSKLSKFLPSKKGAKNATTSEQPEIEAPIASAPQPEAETVAQAVSVAQPEINIPVAPVPQPEIVAPTVAHRPEITTPAESASKPEITAPVESALKREISAPVISATQPAVSKPAASSGQIGSDYSEYLPAIDVQTGLKRIMNNKKLYFSLLGKFDTRKMADDIITNVNNGEIEKTGQSAHALKGASANLGLDTLSAVSANIEARAKAGQPIEPETIEKLNQAVEEAKAAITRLIS